MADFKERSANRSEGIARNWDLVSVGSFATAALIGLVKTANDIRHQFYQTHVIGYDKQPTPFTETTAAHKREFSANQEKFARDAISLEKYTETEADIARRLDKSIKSIMREKMHISTQNVLSDWTLGTWQRLTKLGRTNRMNAAMGFAGTATIALGAIAVLKHSSRVLDAINQRLSEQQEKSR